LTKIRQSALLSLIIFIFAPNYLQVKKNAMKKNMGMADRIIRIVIALVVIALYAFGKIPGVLGIVLIIVSGIFILTSMISICPLYIPLKINTRGKKE